MEATVPAVSNEKKRKRPRAARACEFCRAKKYRCDELYPCSQCRKQRVDCVYEGIEHIRQRMLMSNNLNETENERPALHQSIATGAVSYSDGQNGSGYATTPPPRISDTSLHQHRIAATSRGHGNYTPDSQRVIGSSGYIQSQGSEADVEVADVNQHTRNVEFHGKTSSIAFLAALNPQSRASQGEHTSPRAIPNNEACLVSAFHNNAFSPDSDPVQTPGQPALDNERYYFRQSRLFLEGHFQNIHFIHPIIDKSTFISRCEDLWFGKPERQPRSFVALYYSIMSLGALVRTWDDGEKLDGLGRLEWSRRLSQLASIALRSLRLNTDIETIQAYFFMAKVSQNELNPSLAYMFLGLATRTCFSAGCNREPKQVDNGVTSNSSELISRTWWGLYSLEIEISFALGRPDSLGPDEYHDRRMLPLDDTETAIIPAMVNFARIVRKVCISIYLSDNSMDSKIQKAIQIESMMDEWLSRLPENIRPALSEDQKTSKIVKEPLWAKRQRLVLGLRKLAKYWKKKGLIDLGYYNVKMVLFRPFLASLAEGHQQSLPDLRSIIGKCLEAGRQTVIQMHDIYINQAFFRTWWYNTTYVLYAASIILCYATKVAPRGEVAQLLDLGDKAVDILEAMDESVVARNAASMVKGIISQARERLDNVRNESRPATRRPSMAHSDYMPDGIDTVIGAEQGDFADMNLNLDFFDLSFSVDGAPSFWADSITGPGIF